MSRIAALIAAPIVCASCAKGTPTNPILPPGVSPTPLPQPEYVGIGRYQELASITTRPPFGGIPFVSFVEVREPAEGSLSHQDVPGFVYAYQNSVVVAREGADITQQQAINQGTAKWVPFGSDYVNASGAEQVWYFVAPRSITTRGQPLTYPSARVLYASGDLPTPPSDRQLVFQLSYITMDVGGRTSAHSHGGSEVFYVIKGTVALATNDGQRTNITTGQGATIKPGVVMQLHVVGEQPVQILTFFLTAEGAPWQTNLQTLP